MWQKSKQIAALAGLTALDIIRQPITLLLTTTCIVFIALLPMVLTHTLGEAHKLVRDSALAFYFIFGLLSGSYAACSALVYDIRKGTVSSILSKPVNRSLFFLSKFFGVAVVALLFSVGATLATLMSTQMAADAFHLDGRIGGLLFGVLLLAYSLAAGVHYFTSKPFASHAFFLMLAGLSIAFFLTGYLDTHTHPPSDGTASLSHLLSACILIAIAILMLCAIAVSLAVRLDMIPTFMLCSALFLLGLFSDYLFGRPGAEGSFFAGLLYTLIPNWQHFLGSGCLKPGKRHSSNLYPESIQLCPPIHPGHTQCRNLRLPSNGYPIIMKQQTGPSSSVIQAVELTKVFRDFWRRPRVHAVSGITFDVQPGEVFGLLGPNGSGKSTTIKMMLGLLHATGGSLQILGQSPHDVKTKERIGYLPEESYLYPYLTAEETLQFYGNLFALSAEQKKERIEQLLDMVGLTHARKRRVGEFSKGMARRIGLAQALINDPDLVILDEPTSGLDPLGCRQVKDIILALAERGKTVLLSSHLLADTEDVCHRIAILYNGRIQAMGPLRDLLEEKNRCRLTLPALPPETMQSLLAQLRKTLGEEFEIDHPRNDLEAFFLNVVAQARQDSTTLSGTGASQGIAKFLSPPDPPA